MQLNALCLKEQSVGIPAVESIETAIEETTNAEENTNYDTGKVERIVFLIDSSRADLCLMKKMKKMIEQMRK